MFDSTVHVTHGEPADDGHIEFLVECDPSNV